uniref:Uncharacterized protein n=1 Tax=uncultured Flavobacteriia bacterium TaxID=212695 RepID=H6RDU3_9BACT|nr:hypothetical protein [uncultured bacterium]CCF99204.1 conserved hypothetical protein [uncultured Flavobacteriia bacterium]
MKTRFFLLFLLFVSLSGCRDMETKKVSSESILAEELKEIDMKEVDEYPSMEGCDSLATRTSRKRCFERELSTNFQKFLATKILVFSDPIRDTIWLDLSITATGEAEINAIKIPDSLERQIPQMQQWLRQSLDSLPEIYPAIKRGIPVRTAFKMPVVIRVE